MPKNYESVLLQLEPETVRYTPNSLPLGQVIAHGTTRNDLAVEKAMRLLAKSVPFTLGRWPSFTTNVEDEMRVEARLTSISVLRVERGQGRFGHRDLAFVDAFYQVLRLLVPKYSVEAEVLARSGSVSAAPKIARWLELASLVKHMHEVNEFFGGRAAGMSLTWMSNELVKMGAYRGIDEALAAEATLVHVLQLGGIPEQHAREIYRKVMPGRASDTATTQASILVSETAFASSDPHAVVASNAEVTRIQLDAKMTHGELSADALRSYYVDYFWTQFAEGGFAQFVYNSGWDTSIVAMVRGGLKSMGASWYHQLFERASDLPEQIGRKRMRRFLTSTYLAGADTEVQDPVVQKVAEMLNRYNGQFLAEDQTTSLRSYNADWLRAHQRLAVLSVQELADELRKRVHASPDRQPRNSQADVRAQRLIRSLCVEAGHEPNDLEKIIERPYFFELEHRSAWDFSTDAGSYFMVDVGEQALMFDAEIKSNVCKIDANHQGFNPGISIDDNLMPHLVGLIEADDHNGVEAARDLVEPRHLGRLIEHYNTLERWDHKRLVIDMIQDHRDPRLRPLLLDFLRQSSLQHDSLEMSQVAALAALDDYYDQRRQSYYNDRALLKNDIDAALHGDRPPVDQAK